LVDEGLVDDAKLLAPLLDNDDDVDSWNVDPTWLKLEALLLWSMGPPTVTVTV